MASIPWPARGNHHNRVSWCGKAAGSGGKACERLFSVDSDRSGVVNTTERECLHGDDAVSPVSHARNQRESSPRTCFPDPSQPYLHAETAVGASRATTRGVESLIGGEVEHDAGALRGVAGLRGTMTSSSRCLLDLETPCSGLSTKRSVNSTPPAARNQLTTTRTPRGTNTDDGRPASVGCGFFAGAQRPSRAPREGWTACRPGSRLTGEGGKSGGWATQTTSRGGRGGMGGRRRGWAHQTTGVSGLEGRQSAPRDRTPSNIFPANLRYALAREGLAASRRRYASAPQSSRRGPLVTVSIF